MSYQPEERYWTDYLRIALPIVGLLLMLALFWFWARSIIGDDNSSQPTPSTTANNVVTATVAPPTATVATTVQATQVTATATEGTGGAAETPATGNNGGTNGGENPTETPPPPDTPPGKGFAKGDTVVVSDAGEGANLRTEASLTAETLGTLSAGDELEVVTEAVEVDNYFWVEVSVQSGNLAGQTGFVADEFLDPSQ